MKQPVEPVLKHRPLTNAEAHELRQCIEAEDERNAKIGTIGKACTVVGIVLFALGAFFSGLVTVLGVIVAVVGRVGAFIAQRHEYRTERRGLDKAELSDVDRLTDMAEEDFSVGRAWKEWVQEGLTIRRRDVEALEAFANRRKWWAKERAMAQRVDKIIGRA